jgi:two-component system sensor histidine kinase/response regulator
MRERQRGHVLLVEDNELNQVVTVAILNKLGYQAEVVDNGPEAVEAVTRRVYGAVLMDCQLPGMDGCQATAEIRRREGTARHIPIIAMTASAFQEDRERCLAAGMDDYLAKPVMVGDIRAVLARWLPDEAAPSPRPGRADGARPAGQVIDPDRLAALRELEAAGDRSALVARVVDAFVTGLPANLADLHAAVGRRDATAVDHAAHSLKGAAATLGGLRVVELCEELPGLAGDGAWTAAGDLVRRLEQELDSVQSALDAAMSGW